MRERAGWRPVPAQLVTGAPFSYGYDVMVAARWRAPDGAEQHGRIRVPPGTRAGTVVTVWAGHTGLLTRGPLTPSQARIQATFTAAMAVPCWGMLLLCTGVLGRRLLDARRLAAWDTDWAAVDPPRPGRGQSRALGLSPGARPVKRRLHVQQRGVEHRQRAIGRVKQEADLGAAEDDRLGAPGRQGLTIRR